MFTYILYNTNVEQKIFGITTDRRSKMKTKMLIPLILILILIMTACSPNRSETNNSDNSMPSQDDVSERVYVSYPEVYDDIFGNKVTFNVKAESFLCWDYSVLNSALAATDDPSFIAGFNKEDVVGTLIYRLYPELENVPSIIKDGQVDIEAVKNSGSEYVILTDESTEKYADTFREAGLQPMFTSYGEGISIGHNTIFHMSVGADFIYRYNYILEKHWALMPEDLDLELKEIPFAERRSALFLGDTMNSVYTAVCAQQMMDACMAENAAEDLEIIDGYMTKDGTMAARYTTVTPEQLQEWNPDVIWIPYYADYTAEDVLNNPDFQNITAVKNGEVYTVPGALEPWYYPTLAIRLGTIWAAYTLYPDICPYERVVQEANSYYADVFNAEFTEEDMGLYRIK